MFNKKNDDRHLYAVVGLGRFGSALAQELAEQHQDVLVIDRDRAKIDAASVYTDYAFVSENLTFDSLKEAGVGEADVAVVCIGDILDVSILTTMNLLKLGVPRVIAKASSEEHGEILRMLGAEVAYPEHDMAVRLAARLISPHILEYIALSDGVDLAEIRLSQKADGKTVLDLNVRKNFGLNIIALRHDGKMETNILPETIFSSEDSVTVIGKADSIRRFEEYLGHK